MWLCVYVRALYVCVLCATSQFQRRDITWLGNTCMIELRGDLAATILERAAARQNSDAIKTDGFIPAEIHSFFDYAATMPEMYVAWPAVSHCLRLRVVADMSSFSSPAMTRTWSPP